MEFIGRAHAGICSNGVSSLISQLGASQRSGKVMEKRSAFTAGPVRDAYLSCTDSVIQASGVIFVTFRWSQGQEIYWWSSIKLHSVISKVAVGDVGGGLGRREEREGDGEGVIFTGGRDNK